jgi:hypothetical protein
MKTPFIEDYVPSRADPLGPPASVPFPYEEVYARLDAHGGFANRDREELAAALKAVIGWLVSTPVTNPRSLKVVGQRAIALAWVLDPKLLQGRSLSRIAKGLGISPDTLQRISGQVSRAYGIRNRGQSHAANWRRDDVSPSGRRIRARDAKESFMSASRRAGPKSQEEPKLSRPKLKVP